MKKTLLAVALTLAAGVAVAGGGRAPHAWSTDDVRVEAGLRANSIACSSPTLSASFIEASKRRVKLTSIAPEASQNEQAISALVAGLVPQQPKRDSFECKQFNMLLSDVTAAFVGVDEAPAPKQASLTK